MVGDWREMNVKYICIVLKVDREGDPDAGEDKKYSKRDLI